MDIFKRTGAHVLVDGQFGSTGKGNLASWLYERADVEGWAPDVVVSNAGPNSGHTFYNKGVKHVLKQLPTFGVIDYLERGSDAAPIYLSAGAIINPDILRAEMDRYSDISVMVHPNAAIIRPEDIEAEHSGTVAAVAGTASGTGAAIARKVLRDPTAVAGADTDLIASTGAHLGIWTRKWGGAAFVEVSQGFSLGLNDDRFYPKVTSRECTAMQAMSDARMPPSFHAETFMCLRTFPIRVGNHNGHSSGEWYEDQHEVDWKFVGVEPELTTVTQRQRRIATLSLRQIQDAIGANDPSLIALNFTNYLHPEELEKHMRKLRPILRDRHVLFGNGPTAGDWEWAD